MLLIQSEFFTQMSLKVHTQAYINGKWVPATDGATFDVFNPATGEKLASVADCTSKDVSKAIGI